MFPAFAAIVLLNICVIGMDSRLLFLPLTRNQWIRDVVCLLTCGQNQRSLQEIRKKVNAPKFTLCVRKSTFSGEALVPIINILFLQGEEELGA